MQKHLNAWQANLAFARSNALLWCILVTLWWLPNFASPKKDSMAGSRSNMSWALDASRIQPELYQSPLLTWKENKALTVLSWFLK